ncbi:MAG TPA: glycine cleavage system protein GcvH [Acidobacteriota bacterium]|nr:glycine cleavage system protein GcvH [Acidobacteriota bacterium]
MIMYPEDYSYTKEHEWIKKDGSEVTVGITNYAQKELGDIVYVDLPAAGKKFAMGEAFGSIESVKAVSEIYAPVNMEIVSVNSAVTDAPELINQDPHGKGWLVKVKLSNESDLDSLLNSQEYEDLISQEKH